MYKPDFGNKPCIVQMKFSSSRSTTFISANGTSIERLLTSTIAYLSTTPETGTQTSMETSSSTLQETIIPIAIGFFGISFLVLATAIFYRVAHRRQEKKMIEAWNHKQLEEGNRNNKNYIWIG